MEMNVLLACDDKYSIYAATAITSIRENMIKGEKICVHVLEDNVSMMHKQKILALKREPDFLIFIYDISKDVKELPNKGLPSLRGGNYTTYGRFFFQHLIPADIQRILYIDCDVIVTGSLSELFETNMEGCVLAGVQDVMPISYRNAIGFPKEARFICSGVMLFDVRKWNEKDFFNAILKVSKSGLKYHWPDQDFVNLIYAGNIKILPVKWDYLNILYGWKYKYITMYRGKDDDSLFYTEDEICIKNPIIIHLIERPWETGIECMGKDIWFSYLRLSGFEDEFVQSPSKLSKKGYLFRKVFRRICPAEIWFWIWMKRWNYVYEHKLIPSLYE